MADGLGQDHMEEAGSPAEAQGGRRLPLAAVHRVDAGVQGPGHGYGEDHGEGDHCHGDGLDVGGGKDDEVHDEEHDQVGHALHDPAEDSGRTGHRTAPAAQQQAQAKAERRAQDP